ncbi:MAG: saccharopine dehydrogenase NADP-binding domain-containing protein [Lentihominibacter sp.]|jgi:saccharopine dehydrogenase (NAD+, L-lysine-forming)
MKLLIIGAGGVGTSAAKIIERAGAEGDWAEKVVVADYDLARAEKVANEICGGGKFVPAKIDAKDPASIKAVAEEHGCDFVMNAVDPRMNECIFDTCLENKLGYLDCAMTLGKEHPEKPYELAHIKLGDYQFAKQKEWEASGKMAICGSGVEPGMSDVFAKYAAKHLFDKIDRIDVRDGDNYGNTDSDFGFSVWTTIEECLQPPVIWEKTEEHPDGHWYCTEHFSEPEIFNFPGGIGDVEVVNVEHEEILLIPREIDCNRVTFKYGVPADFRTKLLVLHEYGLANKTDKIKVGDSEITPRDFVVKVIPSPVDATMTMTGKGCAGTWVTGWKDSKYRSVYLYQIADNQECVKKYTTNSVVAQTAVGPVIMLELIAKGIWNEPGAWGPEHFDPDPFVERLAKYEFPAGLREMESEYADEMDAKAFLEAVSGK